MKYKLVIFLLMFTMNGYGKTPFTSKLDSGYTFLYNVQLRADNKTPFEYQFMILRPQKLSFSFKIANVNYEGENLIVKVNSNPSNFGFYNQVKGFTVKPGVLLRLEKSKRTQGFIGLHGVVSHITNETNLYYSSSSFYNEKQSKSKFLFGTELELSEMVFFQKYFHAGVSGIIGYKDLNVYDLGDIIENFPKEQDYSPTQGYSSYPVYVTMSIFLGVNF